MSLHVTVLVTLLNDKRVERTLRSLDQQTRRPNAVLVADGGSTDGTLDVVQAFAKDHPWVRVERHPGTVAGTRNSALASLRNTDVVVFLDADQVAPPGWLGALVKPIEQGTADYAGGPTKPLGPPQGKGEAYLNEFEAWFYPNVVAKDITKLPMGNSAWLLAVLQGVGGFDTRLAMGGEDYDINIRVAKAGYRGAYVPDAWVHHDQSGRNDLRRLLRRKYRYNVGATMAYLKNGVLREKLRPAARNTAAFRHPYERWNLLIQPAALVRGWWMWRRFKG